MDVGADLLLYIKFYAYQELGVLYQNVFLRHVQLEMSLNILWIGWMQTESCYFHERQAQCFGKIL